MSPLRIDREEAGRRVIEIVDGVLQFLEDVLLALAVARHVGDGPDASAARRACASPSGRTRKRSQRAALALEPGDAHLFLQRGGLRAPP